MTQELEKEAKRPSKLKKKKMPIWDKDWSWQNSAPPTMKGFMAGLPMSDPRRIRSKISKYKQGLEILNKGNIDGIAVNYI